MKKHKPIFFIVYLLSFFFIIIFILKINGKFIFNTQIKFVSIDNFLKKEKDTTSNQQKTILGKHIEVKSDSIKLSFYETKSESELNIYIDSLINISKLDLNESDFKQSPFLYNFQLNGKYPLDAFFETLSNSDSGNKLFRIAHYGDSQIEGDRMTFELRKLFQSKFLCEGVGYVPMQDITDPVSYIRKTDESWIRYTVFTNKIKGASYGQGGSVYRYAPSLKSSVSLNILSSYKKAYLYYASQLGQLDKVDKNNMNLVQLRPEFKELTLHIYFLNKYIVKDTIKSTYGIDEKYFTQLLTLHDLMEDPEVKAVRSEIKNL